MSNLYSYEKDINDCIDSIFKDIEQYPSDILEDSQLLITLCRNKMIGVEELLNAYEHEIHSESLQTYIHAQSLSTLKRRFSDLDKLVSSIENQDKATSLEDSFDPLENMITVEHSATSYRKMSISREKRHSIPAFIAKSSNFSFDSFDEESNSMGENSQTQTTPIEIILFQPKQRPSSSLAYEGSTDKPSGLFSLRSDCSDIDIKENNTVIIKSLEDTLLRLEAEYLSYSVSGKLSEEEENC